MITPEVFEDGKYKHIYFRNENDVAIRSLVLNKKGDVVQDEISEYGKDGRHLTSVVFAPDYITVLGYREYHYDEVGNETGHSNYKRINDEMKFIYSTKSSWIEKDIKAICKFYDDKNKFLYYEIFEHDENCGMVWMGTYNASGEEARIPFQSYSNF